MISSRPRAKSCSSCLAIGHGERRAAVAGDVARRVEPGTAIALFLHQAHAHQRLIAGGEDALLRQVVFVVEVDTLERH